MSTSDTASGASASQDAAPAPSLAERARTLIHRARTGTLATRSAKRDGHPFGSLAPYGVLPDGSPTFLISALAVHTQNLRVDRRASLLVCDPDVGNDDPLARGRVTLLGEVEPAGGEPPPELRDDYLARHPSARGWVGFGDFSFHRMRVAEVYFVGGFGAMGWISAEDYARAAPDPLADVATGILAHMNADHRDALVLYCRVFAGVETAQPEMISVDRLGFVVRTDGGDRPGTRRISFPRPAATADEARRVLVEMVRDARARAAQG